MSLWKLKDNISFKSYQKTSNVITEEKEILAKIFSLTANIEFNISGFHCTLIINDLKICSFLLNGCPFMFQKCLCSTLFSPQYILV